MPNKEQELGGEIKAFYLTTGPYDMLAVVDVPNDATLAAHLLWLGLQGNLRVMLHWIDQPLVD